MPMRLSSYLVGKTRRATNTFFYNVLSIWSLLEHLATLTVTTYYLMDIIEGVSFFLFRTFTDGNVIASRLYSVRSSNFNVNSLRFSFPSLTQERDSEVFGPLSLSLRSGNHRQVPEEKRHSSVNAKTAVEILFGVDSLGNVGGSEHGREARARSRQQRGYWALFDGAPRFQHHAAVVAAHRRHSVLEKK